MLIAAATSESMNSIDEEEKSATQAPIIAGTTAKGILKKHPRGKQLISPLESEEKEAGAVVEAKEENVQEAQSSAGPLKKRRKMEEKTLYDVTLFLEKVHKLLSDGASEAAWEWMPHGKTFRVLRWDVLADTVLSELFAKENIMDVDALIHSFKGQLKECGFVEVKRGKDYGSYCHEVSTLTFLLLNRLNQKSHVAHTACDLFLSL